MANEATPCWPVNMLSCMAKGIKIVGAISRWGYYSGLPDWAKYNDMTL